MLESIENATIAVADEMMIFFILRIEKNTIRPFSLYYIISERQYGLLCQQADALAVQWVIPSYWGRVRLL